MNNTIVLRILPDLRIYFYTINQLCRMIQAIHIKYSIERRFQYMNNVIIKVYNI